nr:hypothetical protein [Tanacetum cinerariifolium]
TRHLMETKARMSREAWEIYRDYRVEDSPTGTGDNPTGTGDSFAGTGYRITGTAGTRWREDRPEVTLPPWKKLGIALGPRYEIGESSSAAAARPTGGFRADYGFVATVDKEIMRDPEREVGYGITDSWDEIMETLQGAPVSTDTEEDRPEVTLPPRKRLGIALGLRYEVGESSSAAAARPAGGLRADYGFVATINREIMGDPEREVGYGITNSWDEIVETLQGAPISTDTEDRRAHAYTRQLMETEARMSREAWGQVTALQGQVTALQAQVTTLQGHQGLAGSPIQSGLPEEAGGSA